MAHRILAVECWLGLGGSRLHGNAIYGESLGVDARGCWGSAIAANHITNATVGIAAGGSQNLTINGNTLLQNVWSILITAIEPTLSATPTGPVIDLWKLDRIFIGPGRRNFGS